MTILLGDFNEKVGRRDVFELTIRSENLYEISKDNGVTVLKYVILKNPIIKSIMIPHHNFHKYTLTSGGKVHSHTSYILIDEIWH
jgi:hypothetical protein